MYLTTLRQLDWLLIGAVLGLSLLSIITLYSIAPDTATPPLYQKQILFVGLGFFLMLGMSVIDYRMWNHSRIIFGMYAISLLSLAVVFFLGHEVRGAQSWFRIGPFSIEPIEFVKITLILLFAKYFSHRHIEIARPIHLVISGLYLALPIGFVLLQPDFGSTIVLISIWVGMILIAEAKLRHLALLWLVGIFIFSFAWFFVFKDYQRDRILTFINPAYDLRGAGYNALQAKIAIGSGGMWGKGIGGGTQAQFGFLPEAQTDFIFAAFSEEHGFLGATLLFVLFGMILSRILKIIEKARDNFARLIGIGAFFSLLIQLFINIGMNSGLFPVTGIPLPLMSYGGSSLLATFTVLGLVESIKAHR